MNSDRECYERDRDAALARAAELTAEHPDLDASTVLAALDDEFAGSYVFPSADSLVSSEVVRMTND